MNPKLDNNYFVNNHRILCEFCVKSPVWTFVDPLRVKSVWIISTNEAINAKLDLSPFEKKLYIAFLLLALTLELSGNYWLASIAKTTRTCVIIIYIIMQGRYNESEERPTNNLVTYCCFALLWVLVITTVVGLVCLITDREREHSDWASPSPVVDAINATIPRP